MLLIKNGHVIGSDTPTADVLVMEGMITAISKGIAETQGMIVIDATGLVVAPGLVDMHVHFREPGYEHKEDIMTGAAAAAAGGVTTCCCMPNTSPVADNAKVIKMIQKRAKGAPITVIPYGAVTVGQQGRELTDFAQLKTAGAIALSDDGNSIQNADLVRRAMLLSREHNLLIVSHCEDSDLAQDRSVNEGAASWKLALPGRPAIAEELMVARDAMLAAETGARLHIAHVSTARSVEIIRKAKEAGVKITAETCPQYFSLTENEVLEKGSLARVNPPLRTKFDVDAIISGLVDGTIDAIATDHAPHSADEKALPLTQAPSGMVGLETSLALALTHLYHTGHMSIGEIIARMSSRPAQILGMGQANQMGEGSREAWGFGYSWPLAFDRVTQKDGQSPALTPLANEEEPSPHYPCFADIVLFDPDEEWTVRPERFNSKARNTPFSGMKLRGRVRYTISRGKIVFKL